jgi:hypothetical protein
MRQEHINPRLTHDFYHYILPRACGPGRTVYAYTKVTVTTV